MIRNKAISLIKENEDSPIIFLKQYPEWGRDYYFMKQAVMVNGDSLQYASDEIKNNKLIVELAVRERGSSLQYASNELNNNMETVESALYENGENLQYVAKHFQDNKGIVLMAVQQWGGALKYASKRLKSDKEVALKSHPDGRMFSYLSTDLQKDKEVAMHFTQYNGMEVLPFLTKELETDIDIISCLIKSKEYIEKIPHSVLTDQESALLLLTKIPQMTDTLVERQLIKKIINHFKEDKSFILRAVQQNKNVFENIPNNLKYDRDVVIEAIKYGCFLIFIPKQFYQDDKIMIEAINKDNHNLKFASDGLKDNREFIVSALKKEGRCIFDYMSRRLQNDKEIIMMALDNGNSVDLKYLSDNLKDDQEVIEKIISLNFNVNKQWEYFSDRLKNKKEIGMAMVKRSGFYLNMLPSHLKNDKDIVLVSLDTFPSNYTYLSPELKEDREIIKEAARCNNLLDHIPSTLLDDEDFLLSYIKSYPNDSLNSISERLKNSKDFMRKVIIDSSFNNIQYASESIRNDKEFIIGVIKKVKCAKNIPTEWLDDKEFMTLWVAQGFEVLEFASERLRKDKELVELAVTTNSFNYEHSLLSEYQTFEESVEKKGEPFLFRNWNNQVLSCRLQVANHPNFLPTLEQIEVGLQDKVDIVKNIYQLRKDEWISKIEEQKIRLQF